MLLTLALLLLWLFCCLLVGLLLFYCFLFVYLVVLICCFVVVWICGILFGVDLDECLLLHLDLVLVACLGV